MIDSSSLDGVLATLVIVFYISWFIYETSKGDKK